MVENPTPLTDRGDAETDLSDAGQPGSYNQNTTIHTAGGASVLGQVSVHGGDFVGRDKIELSQELVYEVGGLPNPYPGLRAYTYADREAFAGREQLVSETIGRITSPQDRQTLTFITGSSGSGKSSFAQAGLLPALEQYYQARSKLTKRAVIRPSASPLVMLGDAMAQLGLPDPSPSELLTFTPQAIAQHLSGHTPLNQVNLLLIDQFEELFTQAAQDQSQVLLSLLAELPEFEAGRTHVLATLRSDYLDELFQRKALWDIAIRQGVALRAMSQEELRTAILKPLEAQGRKDPRISLKTFQPDLLERLAKEASEQAAYLPLLQVALQELWNGGQLQLGRYHGLPGAIRERAEKVHAFIDYDAAQPQQERPKEDQGEMLAILTDLVQISLNDDPRRDVGRRRHKTDLAKGSSRRPQLIDDLVQARLLSARSERSEEGQVETVDLIHEALINQWDRLRQGVAEKRELLRRRARFELELSTWLVHDRSDEYLLSGAYLKEARLLGKSNDIVLHAQEALDFMQRSDRGWSASQKVPLLQRLLLLMVAGGSAGFTLAFAVTYFSQSVDPILFPTLLLIELVLGLIGAALFSLGIILPILRKPDLKPGQLVLVGALSGAGAFALMLLISTFTIGKASLPVVGEGLLWGFMAGAGVAWTLLSDRPASRTWPLVGTASGLALLLGESYGSAYHRPRLGDLGMLAPWQVFLAGAVVPLGILLAVHLGRVKETLTGLLRT
jgi:hypothetical protein